LINFFLNIYNNSFDFSLPKIINIIYKKKIIIILIFLIFYFPVIYKIYNNKNSYSTSLEIRTYNTMTFDKTFTDWKQDIGKLYNKLFINHNLMMNDVFYKITEVKDNNDFAEINEVYEYIIFKLYDLKTRSEDSMLLLKAYSNYDEFDKIFNHREVYKLYQNYFLNDDLINKGLSELNLVNIDYFTNFPNKFKKSFFIRHDIVNGSYSKLKLIVPSEYLEDYKKFISIHVKNIDQKVYEHLQLTLNNLTISVDDYFNFIYNNLDDINVVYVFKDRDKFTEFKLNQNLLINELKNFKLEDYSSNDLVFKNVANLIAVPNRYSRLSFLIITFLLSIFLSIIIIILIEYIRLKMQNEK